MNSSPAEIAVWSRTRWILVLAVLAGLHVAGLFLFSRRTARSISMAGTPPALSKIYFAGDPGLDSRLAESLSLQDPVLFVESEPPNLVRSNLLDHFRFSYELTNWTEPYHWLPPADQYFADDFDLYVSQAVPRSALLTERVAPDFTRIPESAPRFPARASLRIEGDLARRRLISEQALPTNVATALLTNTVVGVRVDAAGKTFSSALMFGSGSTRADESAMAYARQARFEKLPEAGDQSRAALSGGFTFGQLVFQWFPAATDATNDLSRKP